MQLGIGIVQQTPFFFGLGWNGSCKACHEDLSWTAYLKGLGSHEICFFSVGTNSALNACMEQIQTEWPLSHNRLRWYLKSMHCFAKQNAVLQCEVGSVDIIGPWSCIAFWTVELTLGWFCCWHVDPLRFQIVFWGFPTQWVNWGNCRGEFLGVNSCTEDSQEKALSVVMLRLAGKPSTVLQSKPSWMLSRVPEGALWCTSLWHGYLCWLSNYLSQIWIISLRERWSDSEEQFLAEERDGKDPCCLGCTGHLDTIHLNWDFLQ